MMMREKLKRKHPFQYISHVDEVDPFSMFEI